MSMIDAAARDVMTPLILGAERHIGIHDQKTIATWMTLKSIVGETLDQKSAAISIEERQQFYRTKAPLNNWKIWLGQYGGTHWLDGKNYLHGSSGMVPLHKLFAQENSRQQNVQTTTISCGKLFLHAFSSTVTEFFYEPDGTKSLLLRQIWPEKFSTIDWPRRRIIDNEHADSIAVLLGKMAAQTINAGYFNPD